MLRKSLKIAAWTGAGVMAALALAVGALALALWNGPVDASFLAPRVERALAPTDGSMRISSKSTKIAWEGWSKGIRLQVTDVAANRSDGAELARFPKLSVRLRIPALLGGDLAVTRIALHKPELRLVRDATGRLVLGLARPARGGDKIGPRFFQALASRPNADGTISALESIEIVDGTLTISDPSLKRSWTTHNLNAELDRDAKGISGQLSFDLTINKRLVHFSARASYARDTRDTELKLRFMNLDPALFASARGAMAALTWVNVPLSGAGTLQISGEGQVQHASLDFRGGTGVIDIPGIYAKPLPVKSVRLKGDLTADGRTLRIHTFGADLGVATISAKGAFKGSARDYDFAGQVTVSRFPATGLRILWPDAIESSTKTWITTNIEKGVINGLQAAVKLSQSNEPGAPLKLDEVDGSFDFSGLDVRYYKHLPPVTGAAGKARFDSKGLRFDISRGKINDIDVGRTVVTITGFDQPKQALAVTSRVKGAMSDILTVLDRPPLRFANKLGVSPPAINGRASATLTVNMRLLKTLTIDDVDIKAKANVSNLFWRKGLFGMDVDKGGFALTVSKAGLRMTGKASLGGEDARIDWREVFGDTKGARRTFNIATVFEPDTLVRAGLDIRKIMSGKFGAKLEIKGYDDGRNTIDGTYDFKQARFTVPVLEIEKPLGMAATGRSLIETRSQRIVAVSRFELMSPVIQAAGRAQFHGDGSTIKLLRIDKLVAGRTNLTASIAGTTGGAKTITLTGAALDLRPLFKASKETAGAKQEKTPPTEVLANIKRVYFAPDRYVDGVKGKARHDGTQWQRVSVFGQVGATAAPFSFDYAMSSRGRTIRAKSANAGAALRALNLMDEIRGGRLDMAGSETIGGDRKGLIGNVTISDFRVSKAPTMARLLALASQDGLANWASSDKGIEFNEFKARFRSIGDLLYLSDARAVGSQVGFTFAGAINIANDTADINGTVVPLYSLNSAISNVPLLGRVLVGEKGGGLLAVRYSVKGPLKNPQISVNPLSMLTPGLLRKLFDIGNQAPRPEDEKPKAPDVLERDPRYER